LRICDINVTVKRIATSTWARACGCICNVVAIRRAGGAMFREN